jgi:hypothetical protein
MSTERCRSGRLGAICWTLDAGEPLIAIRRGFIASGISRATASGVVGLAGISARVGLTLDDLFGESNQHPFCPMIP